MSVVLKASSLSLLQGVYYLATGAWPLLHMRSFMRVTGPKTDDWLVRTVGLLAMAISAPLLRAALRRQGSREVRCLGLASAAAFIGADVPHVLGGRISPIYLLDAAVEAGFVLGWGTAEPS